MTIVQAAAMVGKQALIKLDGLSFPVQVLDVKQAYGSYRFLITPVGGTGERWVMEDSLYQN